MLQGVFFWLKLSGLRDGNRFWYERAHQGRQLGDLRNSRFSDIIRRKPEIGCELQCDVFTARVIAGPN